MRCLPGDAMVTAPDCLLLEGCDFERFPAGGQLAVARQLMAAFGPRLALVGIATGDEPVGRWVERTIDGQAYLFFATGRRTPQAARPLVPARLSRLAGLHRHRRAILSLGVRAAFTQAPEDLIAVAGWGLDRLCYCFPGVENPVVRARYPWARSLAAVHDRLLFRALRRADAVLASADEEAILGLVSRSGGALPRSLVRTIPTHYDERVFFPVPRAEARRQVGAADADPLLAVVGRLNHVKGWDLVLQAFARLAAGRPRARLHLVGDGEDRPAVAEAVRRLGLEGRVVITGFLPPSAVSAHVNAADLVVVGSRREGFSVAMLEALACGKPLVTTEVSGARTLVQDGRNGFVVPGRDPDRLARALADALALDPGAVARESLRVARGYALGELPGRIRAAWPVLS
ncbi:MAG TPA: glycosyltransferase [Anaeromyxobacteraceae bacterium]|nr:glycosyltransferase [Anaeromyxobacteraceae bacterium]